MSGTRDTQSSEVQEWQHIAELPGVASTRDRPDETANRMLSLLSKQKVFQSLPYEVRVELSQCLYVEREAKKGAELISQHELHRYTGPWRLIVSGVVEVRVLSGQGKTSHEYGRGDAFGDGLTLKALPTGTTFLTGEEGCCFVCLSSDDYHRTLYFREGEELDRRVKYFRSLLVPLFASWSNLQVRDLAKRVYLRKFASRQVIVRENETGSDIYFIVKGECRVVREIEIVKSQGGLLKKMVKLLELAVLHPYEYFGELAPFNVQVDQNGKYRSVNNTHPAPDSPVSALTTKRVQGPRKLLPPTTDADSDDDIRNPHAFQEEDELALTPDNPGTRQSTVFSYTPLELLVFPPDAIKEVLVGNPLQRMREYSKGYPSAVEIKNQYTIQHDWATFKHNLVKDIINH